MSKDFGRSANIIGPRFASRITRRAIGFMAAITLLLSTAATAEDPRAQAPERISNAKSQSVIDALDMPIDLNSRQPAMPTGASDAGGSSRSRATSTMIGSLAVCVGAFLVFVWAMRRAVPRGLAPLPGEVVELLGRASLAARQQLQLVRVGKKLVLVSVSPTGVSTVTEITDEAEVERLSGLCQQTKPNSASAAFKDVLGQYAEEPAARGFVGERLPSDFELANRGGRRRSARAENHHD